MCSVSEKVSVAQDKNLEAGDVLRSSYVESTTERDVSMSNGAAHNHHHFQQPQHSSQFDTWPRVAQHHKSDSPCLDEKIAQVKQLLSKDQDTDQKVEKIQMMLSASKELEQSLDFLKRWFGHVETRLNQPILVHSLEEDNFNLILNQHQELHQDIINHSENVLSVMQLSELLVADADMFPGLTSSSEHSRRNYGSNMTNTNASGMDLTHLRNRCKTVEKRWDMITAQSQDRLARLNKAWDNSRRFLQSCNDFKKYIDEQNCRLTALEQQALAVSPSLHSTVSASTSASANIEAIIHRIDEQRIGFRKSHDQLESINKQYWILSDDVVIFEISCPSSIHGFDHSSQSSSGDGLRNKLEEVNRLWSDVDKQFDACEAKLKKGLKQEEEFAQLKQTLMIWLMDLDIRVTKVDLFAAHDDPKERLLQLKEIKRDIATHQGRIDYLNLIGQKLTNHTRPGLPNSGSSLQSSFVENELGEFNKFAKSVSDRVSKLEQKLEYQKNMSRPLDSGMPLSQRNPLEVWESTRPSLNFNSSPYGLRSNMLLTSSTMDLKSFDVNSYDSRDNFVRKSASLSALTGRNRYLASTTTPGGTTSSMAHTEEDNFSGMNSRTTGSRELNSGYPEYPSGSFITSSRNSDASSLRHRNRRARESERNGESKIGQSMHDAKAKRDFFAHRPAQTTSGDKSEAFHQRHNQPNSLNASQNSGRSSPTQHQNIASSMLDLDWDPFDPLQHSTDNLCMNSGREHQEMRHRSRDNVQSAGSTGVNYTQPKRSARSAKEDSVGDSTGTFIKYADPSKKQYSSKQKVLLQKIEPRVDDLKDALEDCRSNLDGAEEFLRCTTPTGEACEQEKHKFSTTIAGSKASVDVVKSLYNKLQETEKNVTEKNLQLCSDVQVCAKRWDLVKSRAMEKRRRLKHNYQLWHQFLADVQSLRDWIVQYSSLFSPYSATGAIPEIDLFGSNEESSTLMRRLLCADSMNERKAMTLHQLESLIQSHRELIVGLNGKKTTLMSINMYMERYTTGDNFNDVLKNGNGQQNSTSLSDTLKDEVNQMNSHFEKLCQQAAKTQKVLQDCLVDSLEVKKTVGEIVAWLNQLEADLDNVQSRDSHLSSKSSSKSDLKQMTAASADSQIQDELLYERHLLLKQLKSEIGTYQQRVNSLRETAEQLLLGLSSPLSSTAEPTATLNMTTDYPSREFSSNNAAEELKQDLYLLSNRVRAMQSKLDSAMENFPAPTKYDVASTRSRSSKGSDKTKTCAVYEPTTIIVNNLPSLASHENSSVCDGDSGHNRRLNSNSEDDNVFEAIFDSSSNQGFSQGVNGDVVIDEDDDDDATTGGITDTAEFQFIDDDLVPIHEKFDLDPSVDPTHMVFPLTNHFDDNNNTTNLLLEVPKANQSACYSSRSNLTKEFELNSSCVSNVANVKSCQRELFPDQHFLPIPSLATDLLFTSDQSLSNSLSCKGIRSGSRSRRSRRCAFPVVRSVKIQGIVEELLYTASFLPIVLDYTAWLKQPQLIESHGHSLIDKLTPNGFTSIEKSTDNCTAKLQSTPPHISTNENPAIGSQSRQTLTFSVKLISWTLLFLVVVLLSVFIVNFFYRPLHVGGFGAFNHILSINVELTRDCEEQLPA